jgi:low affinity Fe/Cu permease
MSDRPSPVSRAFSAAANQVAKAAGRPVSFVTAMFVVIVWAAFGPIFHYSDTWQLVINTGTTIITFLMVFLIQNAQNRDNAAIQVKLDELIRTGAAKNFFIGIEQLTEDQIDRMREICAARARATGDVKNVEQKVEEAVEKVS